MQYRPPASGMPFYPQGQYPQGQPAYYQYPAPYPMGGFVPNVGGQPPQPFPGVYPPYNDQYEYEDHRQPFPSGAPRTRPLNRSQSAMTPQKKSTLKSIMKKPNHDRSFSAGAGADGLTLSRTRTSSTTHPRAESRPSSRPGSRANSARSRADSDPYFTPGKLHLTLIAS